MKRRKPCIICGRRTLNRVLLRGVYCMAAEPICDKHVMQFTNLRAERPAPPDPGFQQTIMGRRRG